MAKPGLPKEGNQKLVSDISDPLKRAVKVKPKFDWGIYSYDIVLFLCHFW